MSYPAGELASDSNHGIGTDHYPSVNGMSLALSSQFSIGIRAAACVVAVQISMNRTDWFDVTDWLEDVPGGWLGGPVTFVASTPYIWQGWFFFAEFIRLEVVYAGTTNSIEANIGRRTL